MIYASMGRFLTMAAWSVCLWLSLMMAEAHKLTEFSLKPRYDKVGERGLRELPKPWYNGGNSEVKKHFVRLTPDRQSKAGYVWNDLAINRNEIGLVMTFRISGQGQRWFGDGIGLWLAETPNHIMGPNKGFPEKFNGLGITIDTFVNSDHAGGHKDITVQANDGTKDLDYFLSNPKIGCDAAVRYHEKHAGFSPVFSTSRLKVGIRNNYLTINVDPKGDGVWQECYSGTVDLPNGWLQKASLGFTAATGSLADNQDLISVETYTQAANDPDMTAADIKMQKHHASQNGEHVTDCDLDCHIDLLRTKMEHVSVDYEHKFEDLKEKTENTVSKLKKTEAINERRVDALEGMVNSFVDKNLGKQFHGKVANKLNQGLNKHVKSAGGGWKTPFFLLIIGVAGGGAFVYKKYNELRKSHLL